MGQMADPSNATIAELWYYPVKSMAGETVETCVVDRRGVVGDRGYAVVDRSDGKVASAKHPRKWAPLLHARARYVEPPSSGAPLPPVTVTFPDGSSVRSDEARADSAISAYIGRDVALTSVVPEVATFEEVWPDIEGLAPAEFIAGTASGRTSDGEAVSTIKLASVAPGTFLDVAPVHVLSEATLDELRRLEPGAGYDRRRYRPNIVLSVPGRGFVENAWVGSSLRVGDAELTVLLATMRCVMTTLSQPDLPGDRRTLQGIARHNRVEIPGLGSWACAGVYGRVEGEAVLTVGDSVALPG